MFFFFKFSLLFFVHQIHSYAAKVQREVRIEQVNNRSSQGDPGKIHGNGDKSSIVEVKSKKQTLR